MSVDGNEIPTDSSLVHKRSQWIKRKIEDEGVQARNIIKYNVPVGDTNETKTGFSRPTFQDTSIQSDIFNPEHDIDTPTSHLAWSESLSPQSVGTAFSASSSALMSPDHKLHYTRTSSTTAGSTTSSCVSAVSNRVDMNMRVRPITSLNRTRRVETEYRARYWGQMLDTLRRTIDEIYSACETDESEVECKEVIMILDHSKQDFFSLIEKMNLLREFEQADERHKPSALAWDERTTLPGKPIMCQMLASSVMVAGGQLPVTFSFGRDRDFGTGDVDNHSSLSGRSAVLLDREKDWTAADGDRHAFPGPVETTTPTNLLSHKARDDHSVLSESDLGNSAFPLHKVNVDEENEDMEEVLDDITDVNNGAKGNLVGLDVYQLDADEAEYDNLLLCDRTEIAPEESFLDESHMSDADDEGEVNLLSRDIRHLDEAIATVTTAERMLESQLDRAQCAEAALRRRLLSHAGEGRVNWERQVDEIEDDDADYDEPSIQDMGLPVKRNADVKLHAVRDGKLDSFVVPSIESTSPAFPTITDSLSCNGSQYPCCTCRCHVVRNDAKSNRGHLKRISLRVPDFKSARGSTSGPACFTVSSARDTCTSSRSNGTERAGKIPALHDSPTVRASRFLPFDPITDHDINTSLTACKPSDLRTPSLSTLLSSCGPAVGTVNGLLFPSEVIAKSRTPGHGVQMHEKLSARSRKRTNNSMQELEQKQARARILRQQHLLERAERVHELSKKVEEVHMQKRLLLLQRRSCLERRLHAAERKRKAELEKRVLKAHDEETKGREIAFIQTLEAEQKQHTIFTKHEESRARLDELAAERRRRLEEKLGREEAAKGRRRALEASRRARLDALQARWETRAQQLASRAEHLEHTRRAAARAKEQNRETKIASLEEQQRVHIEQLRSRIQRKQEESEKRHQESLREISRKAFEMSVLTHTTDESLTAAGMEPYPVQKWCRACQVTIVSEVSLKSHLQGKRHQKAVLEASENRPLDRSDLEAFNLMHLVDAPSDVQNPQQQAEQDRLRLRRKRARKLRQRMNQRAQQFAQEFETVKPVLPDSPNRTHLQKLIKDARRFLDLPDSGPWVITRVQAMEKTLNAILRSLSSTRLSPTLPSSGDPCDSTNATIRESPDQQICVYLGLLSVLTKLIGLIREQRPAATQLLPDKTYQIACDVLFAVCQSCTLACHQMLWSNGISILVDCLLARFSLSTASRRLTSSCMTQPKDDISDPVDHGVTLSPSSPCIVAVMNCLTCVLTELVNMYSKDKSVSCSEHQQRIQDFLGYVVCSGLVDFLSCRLSSPRQAHLLLRLHSPGRGASQYVDQSHRFVLSCVALLTALVRLLGLLSTCGVDSTRPAPTSQLVSRGSSVNRSTGHLPQKVSDDPDQHVGYSRLKVESRSVPTPDRFESVSSRDTTIGSSVSTSRPSTDQPIQEVGDGIGLKRDPTKLLESILNTEVFGLIPLLYCLLLDSNNRPTDGKKELQKTSTTVPKSFDSAPVSSRDPGKLQHTSTDSVPFRSTAVAQITLQSLMLFNAFATVNRPALQSLLSSELTCLLTRHILLTLLSRCSVGDVNSNPSSPRVTHLTFPAQSNDDKPKGRRRKGNDSDEDIDDFLPSGTRQVVPRSTHDAGAGKKSGRTGLSTTLPDWANEVSSTDPTTAMSKPKAGGSRPGNDGFVSGVQLTRAILHETILCVGHLCSMNPDNQTSLQVGSAPTILHRLVRLPFDYFSQRPLTDILYPTLIACCYAHANNRAMLQAELSPTLLANYIEERSLERTMKALSDSNPNGASVDGTSDTRFHLEHRFPIHEWNSAKAYFAQ